MPVTARPDSWASRGGGSTSNSTAGGGGGGGAGAIRLVPYKTISLTNVSPVPTLRDGRPARSTGDPGGLTGRPSGAT
jgi:hypothetical protein